jgi:hypothetical protein
MEINRDFIVVEDYGGGRRGTASGAPIGGRSPLRDGVLRVRRHRVLVELQQVRRASQGSPSFSYPYPTKWGRYNMFFIMFTHTPQFTYIRQ